MSKDEILKAFEGNFPTAEQVILHIDLGLKVGTWRFTDHFRETLSSALDRYAMHIVEQSVLPEVSTENLLPQYVDRAELMNSVRGSVLRHARQLTNQH